MKKISIFLILLSLVTFIQAKKVALLEGLFKPDMIAMGDNLICITEGASVFLYSQGDYHLVKKFGKRGEGPREFKINPFGVPMVAYPYNNKIYVSSSAKVSVFSEDGDFIKESKVKPITVFLPFLEGFLATGMTPNGKKQTVLSVDLYNEKFEKLKTLYISDMQVGPSANMDLPFSSFTFLPYKDRAYLVIGKEGLAIDVFDEKGSKLYRIKKEYKPLTVTEEYRKKTLDWYKASPIYKQYFEVLKNRITFKRQYPAIRDMLIKDGMIYLLTYKKQQGNSECIILDLKGNEKKRVFLPAPDNFGMDFYPKYEIHNRHFFVLVENEDDEVWELHKYEIIK